MLFLTWARHSFLLLSYLIFFIILIRTPLRHQLRFPLFPFRTSLCFLYVHVVYPSPTVTIDSIRTLLSFSISSYPTCTVASKVRISTKLTLLTLSELRSDFDSILGTCYQVLLCLLSISDLQPPTSVWTLHTSQIEHEDPKGRNARR